MITKTFSSVDQLSADGKPIDKIFTIREVETIEYEKEITMSGSEVQKKIQVLEEQKRISENSIQKIDDEINFLKTLN